VTNGVILFNAIDPEDVGSHRLGCYSVPSQRQEASVAVAHFHWLEDSPAVSEGSPAVGEGEGRKVAALVLGLAS